MYQGPTGLDGWSESINQTIRRILLVEHGILWRESLRLRPRRMPGNGHHGRQDEAAGTAWESNPPRPRRRRGQPDDPATTTDERQHLRNATQLLPKLPQEDSCSRKGTGSAKKTVEIRAQFVRPLARLCSSCVHGTNSR